MNLSNHEKCDKCGVIFDTSPFANMCGNGENAYSRIELYGDKYDLCPRCTHEIYQMIKGGNHAENVCL